MRDTRAGPDDVDDHDFRAAYTLVREDTKLQTIVRNDGKLQKQDVPRKFVGDDTELEK